jgi:hypothetical protein
MAYSGTGSGGNRQNRSQLQQTTRSRRWPLVSTGTLRFQHKSREISVVVHFLLFIPTRQKRALAYPFILTRHILAHVSHCLLITDDSYKKPRTSSKLRVERPNG